MAWANLFARGAPSRDTGKLALAHATRRFDVSTVTWVQDILGDSYWPEKAHVVRILIAVLLGGVIGLERELRDKPAGFRTIILICVGACIFTIMSEVVGGPDVNSTRIAAQIVTGIGFLGAGVILRGRAGVFGLTTASTIWAVAAIGMTVGFGHLALATFGTIVILIALLVLEFVEHRIGELRDIQEYHIITPNTDDALDRTGAMFKDAALNIRKRSCYEEGDSLVVHIVAMGSKANHDRMHVNLARSNEYTLRKA
ncbi:MAG: MgtC/SapB family protein [Phycisphaerae bacterium]